MSIRMGDKRALLGRADGSCVSGETRLLGEGDRLPPAPPPAVSGNDSLFLLTQSPAQGGPTVPIYL